MDNLVRACQFKIPEGVKELTLIQVGAEGANIRALTALSLPLVSPLF